jgi:hypothetical protein
MTSPMPFLVIAASVLAASSPTMGAPLLGCAVMSLPARHRVNAAIAKSAAAA